VCAAHRTGPERRARVAAVKIVTTHVSADFDAFASAVCCLRLYPDHRVLFPGSLEPSVRRFVRDTGLRFPDIGLREARRSLLEHAVVVDTSSTARLGPVWPLIRDAECPVTLIDHHGDEADDLAPTERITRHVGSTCTLLTELFQDRDVEPTSEQASLLLMGLHEDTGSLTYRDTTAADFRAAAWLLECGASLSWVRRWIAKALQPEQLELLNGLVENGIERRINGVPVVVSTLPIDRYIEEAAFVVHRWIQIFELPVGVAILVRPPHVTIILRSRLGGLDVGAIAREFGGGGHATAASARINGRVAVEVQEELWQRLEAAMPPPVTAGVAAGRRIFTVDETVTVTAAKARANQLRVNALPVASEVNGRLIGVVTRQLLDRAEGMGLAHRPVSTIMHPEVPTVDADEPLETVKDRFLEGSHRFVIVTRDGEPAGLLTRMEVFRRLFERQSAAGSGLDHRMASERPVSQNIRRRLREQAQGPVLELLDEARAVADRLGVEIYLVGGAVRDLLLERPCEDLDLVVEGNGVEVARLLAERLGGRCHPHPPFMTAVVLLPDGGTVDVASARTEFYRAPAALPDVATSLIRQDLYRRDFTINALAVVLSSGDFGALIDFFGGRRDLAQRQIRVLHSLSFIDDPTRALRAVRYARRLDFSLARDTRHLVATAVTEGVFEKLSGPRVRKELELLLAEPHPPGALAALAGLGLLAAVEPGLEWSERSHGLLLEIENQHAWARLEGLAEPLPLLTYLGALAMRGPEGTVEALASRLHLAGILRQRLIELPETVAGLRRAATGGHRLSAVAGAVEGAHLEAVLIAMAELELEPRRLLAHAAEAAHHTPAPVNGQDLLDAGLPPGPTIGRAIAAARRAVIDGAVRPEDALDFAIRAAGDGEDGP
jgi:tRNA nucleotidyltransferase (CCA-adding enzyme)